MKALVVYDSFFGNTEKIGQAIGSALGSGAPRPVVVHVRAIEASSGTQEPNSRIAPNRCTKSPSTTSNDRQFENLMGSAPM